MIFVTVGTTSFEKLIQVMDELVGAGKIKEKVIAQIGYGKYIPKNIRYFRYSDDLAGYYKKADLVVAHGGHGTTFEVLKMGKRLISVKNPDLVDDHQHQILQELEGEGYLIWCKTLSALEAAIKSKKKLKKFKLGKQKIYDDIKEYLHSL